MCNLLKSLLAGIEWKQIPAMGVLAVGLIEGIWGALQLFGVVDSGHPRYPVTGSFYNPGPFGCMLGCVFPVAVSMYLRPRAKWMKWSAGVFLLLCALLLLGGMSRTGWIAALAGTVVTLTGIFRKKLLSVNRKYLVVAIAVAGVGLCAAGYAAYHMKKDSADGRVLMWKVAALSVARSPIEGVGWDYIAGAYGEAQEEYFREGMDSGQEAMIAGTPVYVFNEYLQLAIAFGWVSGAAFLLSLLIACGLYLRSGHWGMAGCVTGIALTCAASYPLQFTEFRWFIGLTVICAFMLLHRLQLRTVTVVACAIAMTLFFRNTPNTDINAEFRKAHATYQRGDFRESINSFNKLLTKTSDPMPLNLIGKCYQSLGKPDSAEHYFVRSTYRVPNRFYPHYLLMKLYAETPADSAKMRREANYLLTSEPKTPSKAIDEMREEATRLISYR